MNIGRLRHRVKLQEKQVTPNEFGEEVVTWVTTSTRWASVEPLRGREYIAARAEGADVTHRVRMRGGAVVRPEMRLLHDGRALDIEAVMDREERGVELELMCREQVEP